MAARLAFRWRSKGVWGGSRPFLSPSASTNQDAVREELASRDKHIILHHMRQSVVALATLLAVVAAYAPPPDRKLDATSEAERVKKGVNVLVAPSTLPNAGRGVFAARDFKACELVEKAQAIPCDLARTRTSQRGRPTQSRNRPRLTACPCICT